jgi:hypothetical protein
MAVNGYINAKLLDSAALNIVENTLKDVTPGGYIYGFASQDRDGHHRGLEIFDQIMPEIDTDSTLLYDLRSSSKPREVEVVDNSLQTSIWRALCGRGRCDSDCCYRNTGRDGN